MKKNLVFISFFTILILWSTGFAETSPAIECREYNPVLKNGYETFSSIYPVALTKTAQKNHRNYCCKQHSDITPPQMDEYCVTNPTDDFVDSPWLFDHLVDVGFRYLDGVKDLQYDNTPTDVKGKEWREKITEIGSNPNGTIPLAIMSEYQKFRWDRNKDLEIIQSQKQSCVDSVVRFKKYNQERDTLPLTQKYFVICELSSCMSSNEKNALLPRCQNVARERILQEDTYVQAIAVKQWEQSIQTSFNGYARGYLNHTRLDKLLEKIVMMAKWFGFVDAKVPEMTRMCSA